MPSDGCIRLPYVGLGCRKLSPLNVGNGAAKGKGIMLVIDDSNLADLFHLIVIIGRHPLKVRLHAGFLDPPVKIQNLGMVIVDDLLGPVEPVLHKLRSGCGIRIEVVVILRFLHGRPVQAVRTDIIGDITLKLPAVAHKEPVLYSV